MSAPWFLAACLCCAAGAVAAVEIRTTAEAPLVLGTDIFVLTCVGDHKLAVYHENHAVDGTTSSIHYSTSTVGTKATIEIRSKQGVSQANAGVYNCSDSVSSTTINVVVIDVRTDDVNGEGNTTSAILTCSVLPTSNATAYHFGRFLSWSRNGTELKSGAASGYDVVFEENRTTLNISKLNATHAGEYNCTVEVTLDNKTFNVSQLAKIFWHPHIEPFGKPRSRVEDETAELECLVSGYPLPNVTWHLQREEGGQYEAIVVGGHITTQPNARGVPNARLTVKNLLIDRDRGTYMCIASNSYGSANATTQLKVKDKLAAVWPFLGICAEVAVLCSIIFIFEKRRNKKLEEEEEVEAVKQELLNNPGRENEESKDNTEMRKRPVKA